MLQTHNFADHGNAASTQDCHNTGSWTFLLESHIPIKNTLQDLAKTFQDLASWHAKFSNLQEFFLSCKILVPNPCKNLVLLDFLPDSCKIFSEGYPELFGTKI